MNIFYEDKANAEKQLADFKKRYNYDDKTGTITVNNQKIKFKYDEVDPDKTMSDAGYSHTYKYGKRVEFKKDNKNQNYIQMNTSNFDTNKEGIDSSIKHEITHVKDRSLKRQLDNDRDSLLYKYKSGTDLSKLPKEVRKQRLEYLRSKRQLNNTTDKKEKRKLEKNINKTNKSINSNLEKFINKSDDNKAKKVLAYNKLTKAAEKEIKKRKLIMNPHDKEVKEVLADAGALRSIKNKNIKENFKITKKEINRVSNADGNQVTSNDVYNELLQNPKYTEDMVKYIKDNCGKTIDTIISGVKKVQKPLNSVQTNARMKNAKKIAKMPEAKILESVYDCIFESLQEKVYSGEITLEQAELVNDLAYEKYMMK